MIRRRALLGRIACTAAPLALAGPAAAAAALPPARTLRLRHLHTGERLDCEYAVGGAYVPQALAALDQLLRDHYSGEVGRLDPTLFDLLHRVQAAAGGGAFEVISGYRSAATNERLRERGGGGVARRSLHMEGRAIDVRLAGVALADLRAAALALGAGGVGFYAREGFVHLDTGRVRAWG